MNFRKFLCVVLAIVLALSAFSVTAFASESVEYAGNLLYFDANTTGWKNYTKIFCHIWEYGGDSFYVWLSKKEACTDKDGDGIWTYDLDAKAITFEEGKLYAVVFYNENGLQTYNLLLDTTVIGDTAYCDGTIYENPEDSTKTAQAAFWRNQNPKEFGPELCITSIGNVVGTCVPSYVKPVDMFEDFIINKFENARVYSGKSDQDIIDDTAIALGLTIYEVIDAIENTGYVGIEWNYVDSKIDIEDYHPVIPKPENPYSSPDQILVEWAVNTYKKYEDPDLKTNRLYFLMPNGTNGNKCEDDVDDGLCDEYPSSWYNEYTNRASIYWSGTEKLDPSGWPGYSATKGDSADVYYADVPDFVETILWNNGIIYTTEDNSESALYASHTIDIPCKYDKGESAVYPNGLDNFDNMIYVIDPHGLNLGSQVGFNLCVGEWYYYYGNGCYGLDKDGTDFDCIRDDHTHNDNIYTVAGVKELCGGFGWDPTDLNNRMHYNAEKDIYEKVYTDVPVGVHEFYITIDGRFRDGDLDGLKKDPRSGLADVTVDGSTVIVTYDAKADIAQAQVIAKDPDDSDVLGDVDGDGEVSVLDATAIQLYKAQLISLDEKSLSLADTDKDGEVSILDATQIQLFKAELIPSL